MHCYMTAAHGSKFRSIGMPCKQWTSTCTSNILNRQEELESDALPTKTSVQTQRYQTPHQSIQLKSNGCTVPAGSVKMLGSSEFFPLPLYQMVVHKIGLAPQGDASTVWHQNGNRASEWLDMTWLEDEGIGRKVDNVWSQNGWFKAGLSVTRMNQRRHPGSESIIMTIYYNSVID